MHFMLKKNEIDKLSEFWKFYNPNTAICTVSINNEPNFAFMKSARVNKLGEIEFEVSEPDGYPPKTYKNLIKTKKFSLF